MRSILLTIALGLGLAPTVTAATAQTQSVTIAAAKRVVVYGASVRISGVVSNQQAEAAVTVSIRRFGEPAFVPVSNSTIDASGAWSFVFEPTVRSDLQAQSGQGISRVVTVRVKPRLTLTRRRGVLFAQAVGARTFRGRHVWLQRRTKQGHWRSLRKIVLDDPPRRVRVMLPRGVSRIRVSLPRRQAGPGYEPTVSRVLVLRR
jgi:hypothetical protein